MASSYTERVREEFNTYGGFLLGMAISAFSLAKMGVNAPQGSFLPLLGWSVSTWTGYLYAHYSVTGKIIDGLEGDGNRMHRNRLRAVGKLLGALVFVSGFIIGVDSVRTADFARTFIGSTLFWSGYVLAHYSTTGDLL